jgi:phage terminase large subunit
MIADLPPNDRRMLAALLQEKARRDAFRTQKVVGFVDPQKGFTHALKRRGEAWVETSETPDVYLAAKFERVLRSRKRFIVIIGGRGSSKSVGAGDICLLDVSDRGAKVYCLREYQSSIKNSVHSLLKAEIDRLQFDGFEVLGNSITHRGIAAFEFSGLSRNVDSIKSAHGFTRFWCEETQSFSKESLQALTPTARQAPKRGLPMQFLHQTPNAEAAPQTHTDALAMLSAQAAQPGVSMLFVANPGSSEDPFSKRFIVPFLTHLERDGFYEDDLHLIITMNYMDNPWFMESGLEQERLWDLENLPRALYDHIWLGKFNDSVDSALILAEWFDACIDAHLKLGFQPRGAKIASHDPSDVGPDSKGYAMRHGCVVLDVQEKTDGNVNEGGHWAANIAIAQGVDSYSWDGNGVGAGLAEQTSKAFAGKAIQLSVFQASEGPDFPDLVYQPALGAPVENQKTNKDVFRNKRAQYAFALRDRIYRTYRAVVHHEYADPDSLISFSSGIPLLSKLRAETCRVPRKPNTNGLNELYSKEEMKRLFKIPSPNLFDAVMQTMRHTPAYKPTYTLPPPVGHIGRK